MLTIGDPKCNIHFSKGGRSSCSHSRERPTVAATRISHTRASEPSGKSARFLAQRVLCALLQWDVLTEVKRLGLKPQHTSQIHFNSTLVISLIALSHWAI